MNRGAAVAMSVTGVITLGSGIVTGFLGWMIWALALNGFMGQQRAVETSLIVYILLALVTAMIAVLLSVLVVYYLTVRRLWNAAGSVVLSTVTFVAATGILHFFSVIISAVVAEQMRSNR